MKLLLVGLLPLLVSSSQILAQPRSTWRAATPAELQAVLPARAQVENERIETEMRTASGIIDSQGRMIAGVVLITAGYSADGKYSHYILIQSPIRIGDVSLAPGNYVLGWRRGDDSLQVDFYDAATGDRRGTTEAHRIALRGASRIVSRLATLRQFVHSDWALCHSLHVRSTGS